MPLNTLDEKSTSVQVMAWCRQATSHFLSQCWPRSTSPYSIARSLWIDPLSLLAICFCYFNNIMCPVWSHLLSNGQTTLIFTHLFAQWSSKQAMFNSLAPGRCGNNFKPTILKLVIQNDSLGWALAVKMLSGECYRTSLMRSQCRFR